MFAWVALVTFLPVLFVAAVWAIVTACRILFPDDAGVVPDEAAVRAAQRQSGYVTRVGAREIRADIRLWQRRHTAHYCYDDHQSAGVPEAWRDDVAHRMN